MTPLSSSEDLIREALRLLEKDAALLIKSLGERGAEPKALPPLRRNGENLHVHIRHAYLPVEPDYQMGALYASLASVFLSRSIRDDTIILCSLPDTLKGMRRPLLSKQEWSVTRELLFHAAHFGYRRVVIPPSMVVVPAADEYARSIQSDGRPRIAILRPCDIITALALMFDSVGTEG